MEEDSFECCLPAFSLIALGLLRLSFGCQKCFLSPSHFHNKFDRRPSETERCLEVSEECAYSYVGLGRRRETLTRARSKKKEECSVLGSGFLTYGLDWQYTVGTRSYSVSTLRRHAI